MKNSKLLSLIAFSLILLTACGRGGGDPVMEAMPAEPEATALREFDVTVSRWSFEPASIAVNAGEEVTLRLTSDGVDQSFGMPDFGIGTTLTDGAIAELSFIADETGVFASECGEECGGGPSDMSFEVVVN